jgi:hypothetical protein
LHHVVLNFACVTNMVHHFENNSSLLRHARVFSL